MPAWWGLLAAAASAAALVATYWDDSWHTDRGRDAFAIPPHLLLYGGVTVASLAVAAWAARAWLASGGGARGVRLVLADPALRLAGLGGVTTLLSAPIDAAWHEAYGRDAVLWSPPHLTAVAGTLALSVGLLAGLRATPGRAGSFARLAAAAAVLGTLQVPVLEYDSDVPQFATVLFLPVAAFGLCFAVALMDDLLPGRWAPAMAGAWYTALRLGTVGLLSASGFSLTSVPPVLPLLLLTGFLAARPLALRLVVVGAVSPVVWWPVLKAQGAVTTVVPAEELPASVLLGAALGLFVAVLHGDIRPPLRRRRALSQAVAVSLLLCVAILGTALVRTPAWAHDPGQGEQVRQGELSVLREDSRARLSMLLTGPCAGLEAVRTVARRAGTVRTGSLTVSDTDRGCRLAGEVGGLSSGRWFVYAEARDRDGAALEAWLPSADEDPTGGRRPLYAPAVSDDPATRNAVGALLLAVVTALVVACLRLARRAGASKG